MIGHAHAELVERLDDLGNRARGFVGVDRDAHQLGAGVGQRHHLIHGRLHIGRIGVGHRLDHDRVASADLHTADVDGHRAVARISAHEHHLNCSNRL